MLNLRLLKLSDSALWLCAGALVAIGFLAIFSSTYSMQMKAAGDALLFIKRQFLSLLLGIAAMSVFSYFDYRHLKRASFYFYFFTILALFLVLFWGDGRSAAQRWFQLGGVSIQPSEFSKVMIIVALAGFLNYFRKISSLSEVFFLFLMAGVPFFLIFKQPDLGTAMVVFAIFSGMLYWSGASPRLTIFLLTPLLSIILRPFLPLWIAYLVILAALLFLSRASWLDWLTIFGVNVAVGLVFPLIWSLLKEYQRLRIITFLNPGADPFGAGYHALQSKIAIGSGGLLGKGFLHGTQTQLQFIPEQHSDFIFSVIGEEFGLLGAGTVLALYFFLMRRILFIAREASDYFGGLLAMGVAAMLLFQVLANVGMTLGILPIVGIPLPFLSFGGSSLVVSLISVGILQSISMRRQKIIF